MHPLKTLFAAGGLLAVSTLTSWGQTPIVYFDFNAGSGTSITNSGSAGSAANATITGAATWTAGVSGLAGDFAFLNNGTAGSGANSASSVTALDGLSAFTITGWVRQDPGAANLSRIVDWRGQPSGPGVGVWKNTDNTIQFQIGSNPIVASNSFFLENDTWIYFAMSYDGATGAASFYKGTTSGAATLFNATTTTAGLTTGTGTHPLAIGNRQADGGRPWVGAIDGISIYSGALDLTQVETIRSSTIPEPSTYAAMAGAVALGFIALRRRR